jgi:DNA-binding MarR family transcriptional regulator
MSKASNGLDRSPIHLLHRAAQAAEFVFSVEIGDSDLTPRQLAVLVTVANNEGLNQTGLVDRTGIDRSTLADLVKRLQRKGLLQRRRSTKDARAYVVKLTDDGQRLLRLAEPLSKRVDNRIIEALPAKHRNDFLDRLSAIVDTLQHLAQSSSRPQR